MKVFSSLLVLAMLICCAPPLGMAEDEVIIEGNTIRIVGSGEAASDTTEAKSESFKAKKQTVVDALYESEKRQAKLSRERREAQLAASLKSEDKKSKSSGWDSSQQKYYPVTMTKSPQCQKS